MKIKLSEPDGPYSATIDTEAMNVTITEAFLGARFVSPDGNILSVCMRDDGFECRFNDGQWFDVKPDNAPVATCSPTSGRLPIPPLGEGPTGPRISSLDGPIGGRSV